ncbi:hypothetical protein NM688_g2410 [Phlebia brevispora]|uniref:Uncharacterized protein n=1 Tax=Phlebia brevispora TaxID=194682 RepID=A0ACC1T918_9APHY|nr:hypothetical protein NM688_g2410 [Phlebia brevispora]
MVLGLYWCASAYSTRMPVAPLDENGTVLYYEDSGAPDASTDYLTIVLVHGMIFHGAIFRPLLPLAQKNRLRFIFVNMRDYPGSSGFSEEELEALGSADPDIQAGATRNLGQDIAICLEFLVRTLEIPAITETQGRRNGGIALVGWSMGNMSTLAMLGKAQDLPEETIQFLQAYLRTVVLYDPTVTLLGIDAPKDVYYPLRDANLSLEERKTLFSTWVSFYFTPVEDLDAVTEEQLARRQALHEGRGDVETSVTPTVMRMSKEQHESVADLGVLQRSYNSIRLLTKKTYGDNFRRSLFDAGGVWPDVDVLFIWCDSSMSDCIWAAKDVADQVRASAGNPAARRVQMVKLAGNHFVHWDAPESFVRVLAENL